MIIDEGDKAYRLVFLAREKCARGEVDVELRNIIAELVKEHKVSVMLCNADGGIPFSGGRDGITIKCGILSEVRSPNEA